MVMECRDRTYSDTERNAARVKGQVLVRVRLGRSGIVNTYMRSDALNAEVRQTCWNTRDS